MRLNLFGTAALVWSAAALALVAAAGPRAQAADMKFEAHLVWGTDDPKPPPEKPYKPVDPEIRKALTNGPLRWKNWFEVNRKGFTVPARANVAPVNVPVSDKCQVTVQSLGGDNLEVVLIGKGKEAGRRKQPLPKGELLMLSGAAPGATAWMVVLKRVE